MDASGHETSRRTASLGAMESLPEIPGSRSKNFQKQKLRMARSHKKISTAITKHRKSSSSRI